MLVDSLWWLQLPTVEATLHCPFTSWLTKTDRLLQETDNKLREYHNATKLRQRCVVFRFGDWYFLTRFAYGASCVSGVPFIVLSYSIALASTFFLISQDHHRLLSYGLSAIRFLPRKPVANCRHHRFRLLFSCQCDRYYTSSPMWPRSRYSNIVSQLYQTSDHWYRSCLYDSQSPSLTRSTSLNAREMLENCPLHSITPCWTWENFCRCIGYRTCMFGLRTGKQKWLLT